MPVSPSTCLPMSTCIQADLPPVPVTACLNSHHSQLCYLSLGPFPCHLLKAIIPAIVPSLFLYLSFFPLYQSFYPHKILWSIFSLQVKGSPCSCCLIFQLSVAEQLGWCLLSSSFFPAPVLQFCLRLSQAFVHLTPPEKRLFGTPSPMVESRS